MSDMQEHAVENLLCVIQCLQDCKLHQNLLKLSSLKQSSITDFFST